MNGVPSVGCVLVKAAIILRPMAGREAMVTIA